MEKQVNSICKSCYYQIGNIGLIRNYINDETCKTLVQALVISQLDCGNALLKNIPLSDKPFTASAQLCCTSSDKHSQKGKYNMNFVPAALASYTFQITV